LLDREVIHRKAVEYRQDVVRFVRDIIRIPSESCEEGEVVERIRQEMERVGFDEVTIDPMGNILGKVGSGKSIILMDAHIDTVGVGDPRLWSFDPFHGKIEDDTIFGRGASDQKGGMAAMVYGVRLMKDLKLEGDFTLYIVGSVQEEDCDGLPLEYIIKEDGIRPDCVVLTEPTNLGIYRGHRGRMEIRVTTRGISCHGSAPERGVNAIYKMARVIKGIEALNQRLADDPFLGKGSVTISRIESTSASLCAVADSCTIHLDRRLTRGETKETAIAEIQAILDKLPGHDDTEIVVLQYERPSWRDLTYPTEKYYPTWVLDEEHPVCRAAVEAYREALGGEPRMGRWTFSTNGVASMGKLGIPTVGFGPANEIHAHSPQDQLPIEHLVEAMKFYAVFPQIFSEIER